MGHAAGAAMDSQDTLAFSVLSGVRPMIETVPLARSGGLRADDSRPTARKAGLAPVPAWREVGRIVVPRTHRSPPRRQCRLGTARRHDWRRSADNHSSHLRCKSSRALRYPSGFGEWSCRDCVRCRISLWRRRSTSERRDRRRLHLLPGAGDRPFAEQVMMHAGITYLKFFMSRSPAILFVILGEVGVLLEDHEFAGEQGRVGDSRLCVFNSRLRQLFSRLDDSGILSSSH